MTEEDEEFQRIEREAKMRSKDEDEDDDIQTYLKPWVGLTDAEVFDIWLNEMPAPARVFYQKLCRSVEAKLKEKNT